MTGNDSKAKGGPRPKGKLAYAAEGEDFAWKKRTLGCGTRRKQRRTAPGVRTRGG